MADNSLKSCLSENLDCSTNQDHEVREDVLNGDISGFQWGVLCLTPGSLFLEFWNHLVLLLFALLHFTDVCFLQIEGKTLHQQKDYDLFSCDAHLGTVAWDWNYDVSKACLYNTSSVYII